jgi:hypothetical protein
MRNPAYLCSCVCLLDMLFRRVSNLTFQRMKLSLRPQIIVICGRQGSAFSSVLLSRSHDHVGAYLFFLSSSRHQTTFFQELTAFQPLTEGSREISQGLDVPQKLRDTGNIETSHEYYTRKARERCEICVMAERN